MITNHRTVGLKVRPPRPTNFNSKSQSTPQSSIKLVRLNKFTLECKLLQSTTDPRNRVSCSPKLTRTPLNTSALRAALSSSPRDRAASLTQALLSCKMSAQHPLQIFRAIRIQLRRVVFASQSDLSLKWEAQRRMFTALRRPKVVSQAANPTSSRQLQQPQAQLRTTLQPRSTRMRLSPQL